MRGVYLGPARRALAEELPEAVASAAYEFVNGPLRTNPWRAGKPLDEPFAGLHSARRGTYRIVYRIRPDKDAIEIHSIRHRRGAYRF
ncbi:MULTISPECIES: type II toxin-antitoxin system RelE family toxin [Nocardiopsidaceae]|uniref:Type II toxin-antitoxin system RelE/ParE family toxin n=1 Tax=Streptomonospora nanhaiensis TaxID=1323731 RepID=A0ABY6YKV9_9ACTN|nr:type II toxin-antitoxin system RelE/ParE family toxin [Streptomonospora nanhaiensis]WAE72834.1 type II toxin-antitoxin system RelE/ParE family toxin [Streptomonospora nanhaiensis]